MGDACKEEIAEHRKWQKEVFDRMVEEGEIERRAPSDEPAKRASAQVK